MNRPTPWLMALSLLVGMLLGRSMQPVSDVVVPEVHVHTGGPQLERLRAELEAVRSDLAKQRAAKALLEFEAHGAPEQVATKGSDGEQSSTP